MSSVRVLVGTRKGPFVLTSDGKREKWDVSGPHFAGWEIYHVKGSPVDPNRIYASQTSAWFGQMIQRSDDGGKTWTTPGGEKPPAPGEFPAGIANKFSYDTSAESGKPMTTHQWYDGTPHPWEFKRVWHLEPCLFNADTVYAGVEDAALFKSTDGAKSWQELAGLRGHGTGMNWQDALAWVQKKNAENYLGHNDWRLPNAKELQSLVDYTRAPATTHSPAIAPMFQTTPLADGDYPFFWASTTHLDGPPDRQGNTAVYVCFGRATGWMQFPPGRGPYRLLDVHGAGAQRSDPKSGDPAAFTYGRGPQGDVVRINNFVHLVRGVVK